MTDAHKNFAYSTVATAPSPATSGTSLVVATGEGAAFPAVPFNATVWPVGVQPTNANAEIVRVTNISTDTFTITRAQEGSSARTVVTTDQIAATITAKSLTDLEIPQRMHFPWLVGRSYPKANAYTTNLYSCSASLGIGHGLHLPVWPGRSVASATIQVSTVGTSPIRIAVYDSDEYGKPTGAPLLEGTVASTAAAAVTLTGPYTPETHINWLFVCPTQASDTWKLYGMNNNSGGAFTLPYGEGAAPAGNTGHGLLHNVDASAGYPTDPVVSNVGWANSMPGWYVSPA